MGKNGIHSTAIIAHSQEVFRLGLAVILEESGINVIHNGALISSEILKALKKGADIIIIEAVYYNFSALKIISQMRQNGISIPIALIFPELKASYLWIARHLNIAGALCPTDAKRDITTCIFQILNNQTHFSTSFKATVDAKTVKRLEQLTLLSSTELELLHFVANHKSNNEIAAQLEKSIRTVEKTRSNIISKLALPKVSNTLTLWATQNKKLLHFLVFKTEETNK